MPMGRALALSTFLLVAPEDQGACRIACDETWATELASCDALRSTGGPDAVDECNDGANDRHQDCIDACND